MRQTFGFQWVSIMPYLYKLVAEIFERLLDLSLVELAGLSRINLLDLFLAE
jgi:hypothetical protein